MNNVLIVVAHCDDEILGCSGFIERTIKDGGKVSVCCLTSHSKVREDGIDEKMEKIHKEMGIAETFMAPYGASELGTIPHLLKVQFIENKIKLTGCNVVITHSNKDLHDDHKEVHQLTNEAVRIYQRKPTDNLVEKVMCMEIPCATLWGEDRFNPNTFIEIDKKNIEKKIKVLSSYENVIRNNPHPRSIETIEALATVRGSQAGCRYAEAFETTFLLERA